MLIALEPPLSAPKITSIADESSEPEKVKIFFKPNLFRYLNFASNGSNRIDKILRTENIQPW